MSRGANSTYTTAYGPSSMASPPAPAISHTTLMAPQDVIDEFWSKFNTRTPGKGSAKETSKLDNGVSC